MQHTILIDRLILVAKAAQSAKSLNAVRILQQQLNSIRKDNNHEHYSATDRTQTPQERSCI